MVTECTCDQTIDAPWPYMGPWHEPTCTLQAPLTPRGGTHSQSPTPRFGHTE